VTVVARIHYEIPDDLHRRAKSAAAMEGMTLKDFLLRALEHEVARATGR
jgi:predicted HicB family RNase H-like nuclease